MVSYETEHRYVGWRWHDRRMGDKANRNLRPQLPFGTYEFFRSTVLYNGEYKESVKQQPGSAEVVRNVADDKYAIGYSGLGYKTEGVRTVPLAAFYGAQC